MAGFYAFLLVMMIGWLLLKVAWKPALIFEYPYFVASTLAVFILPQVFSLLRFPGRISLGAVEDVMLMTCLCLLAAIVGYKMSPSLTVLRRMAVPVDEGRLFHVGLVFLGVAYVFSYLLATTEVQQTEKTGLTGIATIYLFFITLMFPGFAICLMLLLQRFTTPRLLATVAGGIVPLINVIAVRREPTVMLGLTIVLGIYFARRRPPSRLVIFGALFGAMLMIPATGAYRSMLKHGTMGEARQFDLIGNFKDYIDQESILELRNGAAVIEATQRFSTYDFGAGYWNQIVFRFIPAQIVGLKRKNALLIGTTVEKMQTGVTALGYEISVGSTVTGMGDAFQHFGWFGCLFFTLLGLFFRSIWTACLVPHALFAQLLYILICTSAMRAVTHQTVDFLPGFIYQSVFLGLGMLYAARPASHYQPRHRGIRQPVRGRRL